MASDESSSSTSQSESPIEISTSTVRSARSSISEPARRRRSKDDRTHGFSSMRDVARVLVARERDTMDLKRTLYTLNEQLKAERARADAAEAKTREVLALFKTANEGKIAAEQAGARANEELRLYKMQYDHAREELRRAQNLLDIVEEQRLDAEEAAAKARSTARKLKEEKIVMRAREEGRIQGLEQGMAHGRVMGYEEGRADGFEHGRSVASERAYPSAPVTEMGFETPRARHYEPPQVSRPSSSEEDSAENNPPANYTQTLDDNLPMPPPVTTPARMPTPAAAPVAPGRTRSDPDIRPISVHNMSTTPSHPPIDIPPDGWIPTQDEDMRIRLPPPHEMAPPPPTPSPPLSAVLNNVMNIPDEPVMIPPPANPESSRRPKHRRRNSTESQSTTMSQFEILGPPSTGPAPSTLRSTVRDRPNVLSAIAEERERTSSASSPTYAMPNLSSQSFQMPTPTPGMPAPVQSMSPLQNNHPPPQNPTYPDTTPRYQRSAENMGRSDDDYYRTTTPRYGSEHSYRQDSTSRYGRPEEPSGESTPPYDRYEPVQRAPPPQQSTPRYPSRDHLSRSQNIYAPPHSPHSSPDTSSPSIVAPAPSLRPPIPAHQQAQENRGSMSSNEISFTVVPPSRPESNVSRVEGIEPHRFFLSAEDADRPLPSTPTEPDPSTQPPSPADPVIPMLSGQWPPPGFVPTGPPSPVGSSSIGPAGLPLPPSSYSGSTVGPAGGPSEAVIPGGFPGASEGPPPVIPFQPSSRSSQSAGSSRNAPYTRSAIRRSDDDSDSNSSVSSGLGSTDSLTTPPVRTKKLPTRSGRSTPAYAAAPVPPNVMYPVPPTPRSSTSQSLASHTSRAARVPLPASVSGSVSGSVVGGPTTRGSVIGGSRPPSEMGGRSRSPMMGGGRNLPLASPRSPSMALPTVFDPIIPIPIPEPTPITQPVFIPPSPRRPTTPLADIESIPIIPPSASARAASPVASAVSGTTATTTRGKKGKRGKNR
ncbi:hypothetical protein C8Q80DRAFT_1153060 [Daedaleopsis nitida]|nr:hypothetical protein C8Q80DRAFT_1153060 [Daedaleopsis nitida]